MYYVLYLDEDYLLEMP